MPLREAAQRTEEWLEARRGKITASLAAGCLGLDPYISARAAWRKILGVGETVQNRHMRWGVQFEAKARLDYEAETGNLVETTGFWVSHDWPWLGASPDGLIGEDGLVEIKCPTVPPTRVPKHHWIQMLVQMIVTERMSCDYFSWGASGQKFYARVYRPPNIFGLVRKLQAFHEKYVLTLTEPPRKTRRRKEHA